MFSISLVFIKSTIAIDALNKSNIRQRNVNSQMCNIGSYIQKFLENSTQSLSAPLGFNIIFTYKKKSHETFHDFRWKLGICRRDTKLANNRLSMQISTNKCIQFKSLEISVNQNDIPAVITFDHLLFHTSNALCITSKNRCQINLSGVILNFTAHFHSC